MSDTMTWTVNGAQVTAPAGLLPEGILGQPGPDPKQQAARRYDRKQAWRERDRARQDARDF